MKLAVLALRNVVSHAICVTDKADSFSDRWRTYQAYNKPHSNCPGAGGPFPVREFCFAPLRQRYSNFKVTIRGFADTFAIKVRIIVRVSKTAPRTTLARRLEFVLATCRVSSIVGHFRVPECQFSVIPCIRTTVTAAVRDSGEQRHLFSWPCGCVAESLCHICPIGQHTLDASSLALSPAKTSCLFIRQ